MRKVMTLAAVCLLALSVHAAELTVDEIVAKNAEAKGGMEKLRALNAVRFTGKLSLGGMEAAFMMAKKRPEMVKMEFTLQGMTGMQSYDGSTGWTIMPFMGKKDPEAMTADALKEFKDTADFDGPLVDYAKKGNKVELLGKGDVEGTPAYKLKLVTKEGNESTLYLDAETFLEVKVEANRQVQGQEVEGETLFGNYQEVDGLLFPFSIEMKSKMGSQTLTIEKAELNPVLEDSAFKMPAVKPAVETRQ